MLINNLSIIGVGLIGGSLARALRKAKLVGRVTGCNRSEETLKKAVELDVIDDYFLNISEAVRDADVIIIGTPLSVSEKVLPKLADSMMVNAILTDVGSVKGGIINAARETLAEKFPNFVPGHPIAGTEKNGVEASYEDLFVNHRVILTPLKETSPNAHKLVTQMWESVGAEVVNLDVKHHDEVLAATSHLPHMLAYALVDCLAGMQERDEIFKYAAGGFADFTRIASSSPEMWHDICFSNREALIRTLEMFSSHIDDIKLAIEKSESDELLKIFRRAKEVRDKFNKEKK
ncbi:MAG: prephenate dehydrogenase/arogenate dehydrogenase family protein [Pseudomonadota bacterium]|jgi:prephenate dehydrogenase|nr:prephenate dehydrogenase/arogenate dehydrogenase family protein [Pseudomonadota bacterium]|tara:strand:+ start:8099 stop:8968 length:870 start_codon:yes stop_codon:yes gene_type:complete